MKRLPWLILVLVILPFAVRSLEVSSAAAEEAERPGEAMIAAYFEAETARLRDACLADVRTIDDWNTRRGEYRRQLLEMLGLDPLPERTSLEAEVTGRVERDDFAVENVHFQSRAGLYVTGNLYLPKGLEEPAPAILYVCGHGPTKIDGVSYGNKVSYRHHGEWFARNGYVCLTIDSLQLGEIESIHHGTYRYKMWWWVNRGYTPAGVEAWNCVRALDYLQSRKEVDPERLGVTGRSGGGAYSWWVAAIDERIKAAAPVAGITDLENHVVDGTVEGHCDCMFFVNTYRWDYPLVAALVAPRPLLLENSDSDNIFPLDGVIRTHAKVRRIYELLGAEKRFGLVITPGPHKDTQELRVPAFRFFNQHLKGDDSLIGMPAEKLLEPADLKVFDELPADQRNTAIHEEFVPAAVEPSAPADPDQWQRQRDWWREMLRAKVFGGWPAEAPPLDTSLVAELEGPSARLRVFSYTSQPHVGLNLYVVGPKEPAGSAPLILEVLGEEDWPGFAASLRRAFPGLPEELAPGAAETAEPTDQPGFEGTAAAVFVAPRGIGPTAWDPDEKKQTQIRRRFLLLGQTLDGMRVWDARRAIQAVRSIGDLARRPLELAGRGPAAGIVLYASLFEPPPAAVRLEDLPATHRQGPYFLNVGRFLDMPQALAMAAERAPVVLTTPSPDPWRYPLDTARQLGWRDGQGEPRLRLR